MKWWYDRGNNVWCIGSDSNVTEKQSTYNAPTNAKRVKVQVKPISQTFKNNNNDVYYWTAGWSSDKVYSFPEAVPVPETPPVPTITIKDYSLTAKIDNYSSGTEIQFEIVQNDTRVYKIGTASVITNSASYSCNIIVGTEYKVRCRSKKNGVYSEWSNYSDNVTTIPNAPKEILTCEASSETSVRLAWYASKGAKTYDIQYATDKSYFQGSNALQTISNVEGTRYTVTGLETGHTYYFRVRAINDKGQSDWTEIKSTVVGTIPNAPTTWSSTTTGVVGENVVLYWVHNSEDGSKETSAKLEITVNGTSSTMEFSNTTGSDENRYYTLNTSSYRDGTVVEWRVCTKGIVKDYGEWSIKRSITIYAAPTLGLTITNPSGENIYTLTSFPFFINVYVCPYS